MARAYYDGTTLSPTESVDIPKEKAANLTINMEQKALVKYILTQEFRNRYFLEILEFMKAIEGRTNKNLIMSKASRIFELAKIFRDNYDGTDHKNKYDFHFNVELSRSRSQYQYAYDYYYWEKRLRFIHVFSCPYHIPENLIWTSFDNENKYRDAANRAIIELARKWLGDLLDGGSFYKKNKIYFTNKVEAVYFLVKINNRDSIIKTFFYAKCKSRHIPNIIANHISDIFVYKFNKYFNHCMVIDFLDLLARTNIKQLYNRGNFLYLEDICDFVLSKIVNQEEEKKQGTSFSFKGRTLKSVIRLMNEWHLSFLNEIVKRDDVENINIPSFLRSSNFKIYQWEGLGIADYKYETNSCTWIVSELRNSLSLYKEGKEMKHCVFSYSERCASGACCIFNISCKFKEQNTIESMATLEVHTTTKTLVQVRGKYNNRAASETMDIITLWTKTNGIRIDLMY